MASFIDHTNPEWIRPFLQCSDEDKESAVLTYETLLANGGGLSGGSMKIIKATREGKPSKTYVMKSLHPSGLEMSKNLGLSREGIFYSTLSNKLREVGIPTAPVIFSHGDMSTGERTVVMEDLSLVAIQSGHIFGKASPTNWQIDVAASVLRLPQPRTALEVSMKTFIEVAKMHRLFWMDKSLLEKSWLRGCDWLHGEGKDSWSVSQSTTANYWKGASEKIRNGTSTVNWDANLVACMDQAMKNIDWDTYQAQLQARPWTLVHGDLHPANIMWVFGDEGKEEYPLMLDWEVVGLGSGPQDLAQYLISHMVPDERRASEDALLRAYYSVLVDPKQAGNKDLTAESFPFEQCLQHFVEGGAQRWVWLMGFLAGVCPDAMNQYFQDQVAAFLTDHGVTPDNIQSPRV